MQTLFRYVATPSPCGYLPDRLWSLEYQQVASLSPAEYLVLLLNNWRRFGTMLFRPNCASCTACHSLRVPVATFRPDRSQRRCRDANEGVVTLRIGEPSVTQAKLALYDRYHAFQSDFKEWPRHAPKDVNSYAESFVYHPFPTQEWCYYLGRKLVGVGYVDVLPAVAKETPADSIRLALPVNPSPPFLDGGLSGIYFFHDPDERQRSLGTWNILSLLAEARRRALPCVYLGYHVENCRSMVYKARFRPNQRRDDDGVWRDYLG